MKMNRTTQRTIEILELIASSEEDLTLNDIAKALQIPKTSVFDILQTLIHLNMVYMKDYRLKTYAIGVKAYGIGKNYSKTSLLLNSSGPIIKELVNKTGLTALIAKENNGKIIYTLKQEPAKRIIATPEVGDESFMHTTATGKTILAYNSAQSELLEKMKLPAMTSQTITSKANLKQRLAEIKAQGFSLSICENEDYTYAIAAPIFDYNGTVSSSIGVVGLYQEGYNPTADSELVVEAAQKISVSLGWKEQKAYDVV